MSWCGCAAIAEEDPAVVGTASGMGWEVLEMEAKRFCRCSLPMTPFGRCLAGVGDWGRDFEYSRSGEWRVGWVCEVEGVEVEGVPLDAIVRL